MLKHTLHLAGAVAILMLTSACTEPCGWGLVQRIPFPSDVEKQRIITEVPCCGAVVFQDVTLTNNVEVDLTNTSRPGGDRVDGFLTSGDCVRLFEAPYAGVANAPRCQIYVGPVPAGSVSQRRRVPAGNYRIIAQAWGSNMSPAPFDLDVGVWMHTCKPLGP